MYYNKYIKYKTKYLKGGYALVENCAISFEKFEELINEETKDHYFHVKLSKIFEDSRYNELLKYVQSNYESAAHDTDKLNEHFNKAYELFKNHDTFLYELLSYYLNEDYLKYYRIQYSTLIFISFIVDLEIFILCYGIFKYNTEEKPNNNDYTVNWASDMYTSIHQTKHIYILIKNFLTEENSIQNILKYFLCTLELLYKNFMDKILIIFKLYKKLIIENNYKHIKPSWYEDIKRHFPENYIEQKLFSILQELVGYNPITYNLFDFVFKSPNKCNCICQSILELYILSRNRINPELLYLTNETPKCTDIDTYYAYNLYHKYIENSLKITHWGTKLNTKENRVITKSTSSQKDNFILESYMNLKSNKNKILISYIFLSYDKFIEILDNIKNKSKEKWFSLEFKETRSYYNKCILFIKKRIDLFIKILKNSTRDIDTLQSEDFYLFESLIV